MMDIVGPLPRSRSRNRYVLVFCDYVTRYPEAVPLRCIEAEVIAEELMKLFTRVGLPREILNDQESNFQSHLLAELYRLLHTEAVRTSPYHPQTDGLEERFNKMLKDCWTKQPAKKARTGTDLSCTCCLHIERCHKSQPGFHHLNYSRVEMFRGHLTS